MPRRKNISAARGIKDSGYAEKRSFSRALRKRNLQNSKNSAAMKKGMELPINTLVVVAIAVIVILAIAAFFMGGFGGSSKDMQNRQAFMNSCSAWTQTGCAGSAPSDVAEKFKLWQPNTELSDDADEKTDFLAGMCGCFGRGVPGRTEKLCSDYTVSECITKTDCALTKTCSQLSGTCIATSAVSTNCKSVDNKKQASVPYGCTGTTPVCCILKTTSEPAPPSACKTK